MSSQWSSAMPQERVLNLRKYITQVRLPVLEGDLELRSAAPSHELSTSPNLFRRLETVQYLDTLIRGSMTNWIHDAIPRENIWTMEPCPKTQERLAVPVPLPLQCLPISKDGPSLDLESIRAWLPLVTAQRILHLALPETHAYRFEALDGSGQADSTVWTEYLWSSRVQSNSECLLLSDDHNKTDGLLVAVQPPSLLTSSVLFDFVHTCSIPSAATAGQAGFPPQHKLWAKLYESCITNRTHFFVLTSYTHWVFGVFTPGYTTAFVSGVYSSAQIEPSIMELLTYWTASSMSLPGGFVVPKTAERYYDSPIRISCPDIERQGGRKEPTRQSNETISPSGQKLPAASLPFLSTIDPNPRNINGVYWVGYWLTILYG